MLPMSLVLEELAPCGPDRRGGQLKRLAHALTPSQADKQSLRKAREAHNNPATLHFLSDRALIAANQRPDARPQFLDLEGLDLTIIWACIETNHFVLKHVARG